MASESKPLSVLVVDDEPDVRMVLSKFLSLMGVTVFEAETGHEAVHMAESVVPALILMDLSMPVMDGVEAARRIRRLSHVKQMPIIFITAHGDFGIKLFSQIEQLEGGGAVEYLPKPIDYARLEELVSNLMNS